ncbi:GDSL-type esterase/lipase family protein [uncultured Muribaculum sp.]|uniref:GDSL-type esterase/lipase family protein n=1 Tax=uncultured Muribaculum sp. TaxID=1918613 RepID=UPI0025EB4365|nr:GDSL-type esterase/lipase family protein [uncultured Muribaculum sp.]
MNRTTSVLASALLGVMSLFAKDVNIVYVGNSITYGAYIDDKANDAPPARASRHITEKRPDINLNFRNCGVSGMTTVNYLPATDTQFPKIVEAARELSNNNNGELIFSISLGTNDSAESRPMGAPVLPQQYYTNMQAIINELLRLFPHCRVVVQGPIWYSPNTYNKAMYLKSGLERLNSYKPMLPKLVKYYDEVKPSHVVLGDTAAYEAFREQPKYFTPENGNAGVFYLHPNAEGADLLGRYWAEAILKIL